MTGDAHEKAIEAAWEATSPALEDDTLAEELALVEATIAAYLASLAEQGDPLVPVSEVVAFLRSGEFRGAHLAGRFAVAVEARFAPGTGDKPR